MNGLVIFIGESFRLGGQRSRNRGSIESYNEQIKACNSHIAFIEHIIEKYKMNSISAFISTYETQYDNELLSIYSKYLIGNEIHKELIGLTNLFQRSINKVGNIDAHDFILYIRIDLFLKPDFFDIFNPEIKMILFPSICFMPFHKHNNCPRINDMMLYVPKKYYKYLININIYHDLWHNLIKNTEVTYDDMDTMIHTFHDSDSQKDFNPLYYIVNRPECQIIHTKNQIFNKYTFHNI